MQVGEICFGVNTRLQIPLFHGKICMHNKKQETNHFQEFLPPAPPIAAVMVFILRMWNWTEPDNISSLQRGCPAGMTSAANLS